MTEVTVTRWWWLRHAPVLNPDGIFYGQLDFPADLSDTAAPHGQASRLPAEAHWIVTPLRRTTQTANALLSAAGMKIDLMSEPAFIEQNFGDWQGRKRADVFAALGIDNPFWKAPSATAPPLGESFNAMSTRVQTRIAQLNSLYRGHDLVIVAHGGPIRAAIALALNLDGDTASTCLAVDNLSLTRLDHIDDGESPVWVVETLNLKAT